MLLCKKHCQSISLLDLKKQIHLRFGRKIINNTSIRNFTQKGETLFNKLIDVYLYV